MIAIILSLVIIGLILLITLIKWIIDRLCSNQSKRNKICEFTKDLEINKPRLYLLYFFFLSVMYALFQHILITLNINKSSLFLSSTMLSFLLVSFAFEYVFKKRQLIKNLRSIIKLAAANDSNFLQKLSLSNLGNFLDSRDIPLSLILEKQGITAGFVDKSERRTMEDILYVGVHPKILELATEEIKDLGTVGNIYWDFVYEDLKLFDSIMLNILTKKIVQKYPRDIYFLRLHLIEMVLPWTIKGKPLVLEKSVKGAKIIGDFFKLALNKFYMHPEHWEYRYKKDYKEQSESFNINELEKYLSLL